MLSSYLAAFDAGPVAIAPTVGAVRDRIPGITAVGTVGTYLRYGTSLYRGTMVQLALSRVSQQVYLVFKHPPPTTPSRAPRDRLTLVPLFKQHVTRFGEAVRGRERANGTNRGSQKCISLGGEAPPEPRERQGAQACSVRSQEGCAASEDAARRRTHPRSRSLCRRFLRPRYLTRGKRLRDETSAGRGVGRLAGARRRNPSRLRRVGGVPATALFQPHERTGELSG